MSRSPFAQFSDAPMIARAFIQNLIDAIGSDKIAIVVELNKKQTDPTICHSHDFCDANIYMDQALEDCFFVSMEDILQDELSEDDFNEQSDEICNVINAAWDIAKNADFNLDQLERLMNADKFTEIANTAGWSVYNTGGGCMALHHQPTESDYPHFLATHNDDADLPEWGSDVKVSMYRTEDDQGSEIAFKLEFSDDIDGSGNAGYSIERAGTADPYGGPTDPLDGMSICDPTISDCGRFDVNSVDHYGIPAPIANLMHDLYLFSQKQNDGE